MSDDTRRTLEQIKREMTLLAAENLAMQFVQTCILQRLGEAQPELRATILQAFDDAANHAENFSLRAGGKAGHLPETLRIIESMRLMLVGKDKPAREV